MWSHWHIWAREWPVQKGIWGILIFQMCGMYKCREVVLARWVVGWLLENREWRCKLGWHWSWKEYRKERVVGRNSVLPKVLDLGDHENNCSIKVWSPGRTGLEATQRVGAWDGSQANGSMRWWEVGARGSAGKQIYPSKLKNTTQHSNCVKFLMK